MRSPYGPIDGNVSSLMVCSQYNEEKADVESLIMCFIYIIDWAIKSEYLSNVYYYLFFVNQYYEKCVMAQDMVRFWEVLNILYWQVTSLLVIRQIIFAAKR